MEVFLGVALAWVVAHKWWLIALSPFAVAIVVLRILSPK